MPSPSKQGEDQSGVLIFGSTGIAGSIEVAVEAGTNTTGLEFEANITAAFNSSSGPVSSPLLTAPLPAGPYVRAEITGIDGNLAKLTVSDQEFEGNFVSRSHRFRSQWPEPSGLLPPA